MGALCTQAVLEALLNGAGQPGALCTQAVLEALIPAAGHVGCTQLAMEILMSTTSIVWPDTLPGAPRLEPMSDAGKDTTLRSGNDAGPDKLRRRATAAVREFTIELNVSGTQRGILDDFWLTTTAGGTLPFQWKNPSNGNQADFRFVTRPVFKPITSRDAGAEPWLATFRIELLPGTEVVP